MEAVFLLTVAIADGLMGLCRMLSAVLQNLIAKKGETSLFPGPRNRRNSWVGQAQPPFPPPPPRCVFAQSPSSCPHDQVGERGCLPKKQCGKKTAQFRTEPKIDPDSGEIRREPNLVARRADWLVLLLI